MFREMYNFKINLLLPFFKNNSILFYNVFDSLWPPLFRSHYKIFANTNTRTQEPLFKYEMPSTIKCLSFRLSTLFNGTMLWISNDMLIRTFKFFLTGSERTSQRNMNSPQAAFLATFCLFHFLIINRRIWCRPGGGAHLIVKYFFN